MRKRLEIFFNFIRISLDSLIQNRCPSQCGRKVIS
jgi:hypothetical protein